MPPVIKISNPSLLNTTRLPALYWKHSTFMASVPFGCGSRFLFLVSLPTPDGPFPNAEVSQGQSPPRASDLLQTELEDTTNCNRFRSPGCDSPQGIARNGEKKVGGLVSFQTVPNHISKYKTSIPRTYLEVAVPGREGLMKKIAPLPLAPQDSDEPPFNGR